MLRGECAGLGGYPPEQFVRVIKAEFNREMTLWREVIRLA
jgi:hypothetical protein